MENDIGNIISTNKLGNSKVWFSKPRKNDPDAVKKLGRIHAWVFHPKKPMCVGFLVKRPDVALMFRRQDSFVAFDGFLIIDGNIVVKDTPGSVGKSACKRLGIDLDECVIWIGLPIITEDGTSIGYIGAVAFERDTGRIVEVDVDQGATAKTLLGETHIPVSEIKGFRRGQGEKLNEPDSDDGSSLGSLLVSDSVKTFSAQGGIAEKAGTTTAVIVDKTKKGAEQLKPKVRHVVKKTQEKAKDASKVAGKAVTDGAYLTGRQIGRASGMFGRFAEEFKSALNDDADNPKDLNEQDTTVKKK